MFFVRFETKHLLVQTAFSSKLTRVCRLSLYWLSTVRRKSKTRIKNTLKEWLIWKMKKIKFKKTTKLKKQTNKTKQNKVEHDRIAVDLDQHQWNTKLDRNMSTARGLSGTTDHNESQNWLVDPYGSCNVVRSRKAGLLIRECHQGDLEFFTSWESFRP